MILMNMRSVVSGLCVAVGCATAIGCGGAGNATEAPLPEGMGAITASLTEVPADTQCVVVHTSDYKVSEVAQDVVPLQPATIRLAPLSPGYIYLWGEAYSVPCWQRWSSMSDGGTSAQSNLTWQADQTFVWVTAGAVNEAKLVFRKLAALNVDVEFQDPNTPSPDGGPMPVDAGVGD